MIKRFSVAVFAALLLASTRALSAQHDRRFTIHFGTAQADWLSPDQWAVAAGFDFRPVRSGRWAMLFGGHGLINQFTPGIGITRRQSVATALLGAELRTHISRSTRTFLSSALAGSYWWYRYQPASANLRDGHALDAIGILSGLRTEIGRGRGPALSLRAEVRTVFTDQWSWNPQVGVGIAF